MYFAEEAKLTEAPVIEDARDLLADVAGGSVETAELVDVLGGPQRAAIMTDAQCRLSEVTTCWARNPDGTVGQQIDCPKHILGSNRNSAVNKGCLAIFLEAAGQCTTVTKDMMQMLKK
jgi:hypothetical protein